MWVGGVQYLLNGLEVRDEQVGVIVGHLVLENRDQAFQTHPCVDALLRQRLQLRLRLSAESSNLSNMVLSLKLCWHPVCQIPVELDEDQVPDLQHVGVVHVHQVRRVPPSDPVVMDLTAGAAGAGVAHLPEVVLHAARKDAGLVHTEPKTDSEELEKQTSSTRKRE